ncbi:calcium sensing receptor, chloroplastic-like [Hibiscus syriacus]|uniref:calcium sensing receptor, chloroplastic-like n=1 Tax=Hibiscus syriacus TaxID=106335 RepID=UPI0019218A43|nr:calcium sensing receptor, chloroplastic-like [Hibiscus syriacus]
MAIRVSATAKISLPPPPSYSSTSNKASLRTLSKPISTSLSLLALFSLPHEAKAISLSKEHIVSSLTEPFFWFFELQVEKTIDQVQEAGSSACDVAQQVFGVVGKALKPAIDAGVPIAKKAGEEALKVASPVISEALKKAQEAIQGTSLDSEPVLTAAKTAAKQTTEVIDVAKPLASSTFETITSAEPLTIVGSAGALFVAYLLFHPIWSFISSPRCRREKPFFLSRIPSPERIRPPSATVLRRRSPPSTTVHGGDGWSFYRPLRMPFGPVTRMSFGSMAAVGVERLEAVAGVDPRV